MHVFDKCAGQFTRLPMFFMTFHGQESIDKVINIKMDYSNRDRFFKQDTLIHGFRKFATNKKYHLTIVIHPRKLLK
ncbi:unnamed protein product [Adineta steineri]|uniref:Uncharacterized protein n=1 Tax=Adineta steineri TaxID=433720 RepID=A0A814AFB6_9BILA|nr:unnamed protein product [Adineta steineri]CAF0914347.1 unnamed protein product [Adineta steineri]